MDNFFRYFFQDIGRVFRAFVDKVGKREAEFEPYYDQGLVNYSYNMTFKKPKKIMIEDQLANG